MGTLCIILENTEKLENHPKCLRVQMFINVHPMTSHLNASREKHKEREGICWAK